MAKQSLFCKTTVYSLLKKREPLFSGWRIVGFIGAGVSGCVFKMQREDLGETFHAALKVIPLTRKLDKHSRSMDSLQESIGQDAREIIHLYSLGNHQNVVGWYNHEVFHERDQDSLIALVTVMMEYLPTTLSAVLKQGPLPWRRGAEILLDCLKGLEHVHGKRILHRDIKPGNIFITQDGVAKIGDFGVARKLSESAMAETRVGTPLYIAPEVLRDPLGTGYAHQVDIYSLALVGYEMLHGKLPFEDECEGNRSCMVNKRLAGESITLDPTLPLGLTKALLNALAFRPSQRYESAGEFRQALEKVLETDGRETLLPRSQTRQQPAPLLEEEYGEQPPAKPGAQQPPRKIQHYAGEEQDFLMPPQKDPKSKLKFKQVRDPETQVQAMDTGFFGAMLSPLGILITAALGCAAAYYSRDVPTPFMAAFILFYISLPLYMIVVSPPRRGLLVAGAFFLSLCVYNFLNVGRLSGVLDAYNAAIGLMYLGILGLIAWFKGRH